MDNGTTGWLWVWVYAISTCTVHSSTSPTICPSPPPPPPTHTFYPHPTPHNWSATVLHFLHRRQWVLPPPTSLTVMLVKMNTRPSPSWNAKGENGASRCTRFNHYFVCTPPPPTHPPTLHLSAPLPLSQYWYRCIYFMLLGISTSHSHHIHTKYTALCSAGSNLPLPAPVGVIDIGVCTDVLI